MVAVGTYILLIGLAIVGLVLWLAWIGRQL